MTQFEFMMMVASVVVAMVIAEIVGGWGRLLRAEPGRVKFDWLHITVSSVLLLISLQYWVGMWAYWHIELESTLQVLFLVLPTIFLVLSAFAVSPQVPTSGTLDCRAFYLSRRQVIWLPMIVLAVLSSTADGIIAGFDKVEEDVWVYVGIVFPLLLLSAVVSSRIWVHGLLVGFMLVQLVDFYRADLSTINDRFVDQPASAESAP